MTDSDATQFEEARRIGLPLMTGLYLAPVIFWWLLLRKGFANSTRVAALIYALVTFGLGLLRDSTLYQR